MRCAHEADVGFDGDSALDGVTTTPGVRANPSATAPMTGNILTMFVLDSRHWTRCLTFSGDNRESHRHAVVAGDCNGGRSRGDSTNCQSAQQSELDGGDSWVLTNRYLCRIICGLTRVVEDETDGVPHAGPDTADTVAEVHAVTTLRTAHRPVMDGKGDRIPLP